MSGKKRAPKHGIKKLKAGDHFHLIVLPDGRSGSLVAVGFLDEHDGMFYENPEGTIGKVQDIRGKTRGSLFSVEENVDAKYLYVPLVKCKVNPFGIRISFR